MFFVLGSVLFARQHEGGKAKYLRRGVLPVRAAYEGSNVIHHMCSPACSSV